MKRMLLSVNLIISEGEDSENMFKSLTGKILLIIVVLISACTISFTAISSFEIRQSVTRQMKDDGSTLVANIKRAVIQNEILNPEDLQSIFKSIKEDSGDNIVYVSLSDSNSNLIVSDNSRLDQGQSGVKGDATSAASTTAHGSVAKVVESKEAIGTILQMPSGEKVYNISTDFAYNQELSGVLNVGISLESMYEQIQQSFVWMLTISLAIMIVAVLIGIIAARKIIQPLTRMSQQLKQYAEGDFTCELQLKQKDEIGVMSRDLANMRQTLGALVTKIQHSSKQLADNSHMLSSVISETASSTEEISRATDELAAGAGGLASYSQEGLNRLQTLADEIIVLTDRANEMKTRIEQVDKASLSGMNSVRELQQAVDSNAALTLEIGKEMDELAAQSELIREITAVIRAVSEQTNLLALNAMIESARAGEQGRGFAVVADQIRKLADQTASSVQNIEGIVQQVNGAIAKTQDHMHQGTDLARRTTEASANTGQAFSEIKQSVAEVIQGIEVLVRGIHQLNQDKDGTVLAIQSIATITQESTASTEEISASVEQQAATMEQISHSTDDLNEVVREMEKLTGRFKF